MTHITIFIFFNHFLVIDVDLHSVLIVQRNIISWVSSVFLSKGTLFTKCNIWFFGCSVTDVSYSLTLVTTHTWKSDVINFFARRGLFGDDARIGSFIFVVFFLNYLILKVWIQSFLTSAEHRLRLWNGNVVLSDRISLNDSSHNFSSVFYCSLSSRIVTFF